ncbi:MAG: PilN domain-containing protein [Anaerolineales bacterium]
MLKYRHQPRFSEAAAPRPRPIVVDLNFLPERYRGRGLRILITLRPWLFLAGFALMLIPSAQLFWRQSVELATVEAGLAAVREEMEAYQPLADERALLEARIISAEAQMVEIQAAYDTINIQRVTWSDVVPLILAQVPTGVDLTLVSQSDEEVVLEGTAVAYGLPSILADNLEALDPIETVTIQSIVLVNPEEELGLAADKAPAADSDIPPLGEGGEQAAAEQPSELIEVVVAEEEPSSETEGRRPPYYRFKITILLPLFVEPTPEPIDEG